MLEKIVIATGNQGKLKEFKALLSDYALEVLPQCDFDVPQAEETGLSFIENAILKARNAAAHTRLPAVADDSGLAVDALHGEPGIYSARYSAGPHGEQTNDAANNQKLLQALQGVDDAARTARFICALAFMRHALDPSPVICVGSWEGRILHAEQGRQGFGYDPLFYVSEFNCSSAELTPAVKNANSHRGVAMAKLKEELLQQGLLQ